MSKLPKLILSNIIILILILFVLDIIVISAYKIYIIINNNSKIERRYLLPNYENKNLAKLHFEENNNISTQYKSFVGWRRTQYSGETININNEGYRFNPDIDQSIEINKPMAIFLGGSTMWGTGVEDKDTIPEYFRLHSNNAFNVMNIGETGYNAYQSHLELELNIMRGLKPDFIITYDGVNEINHFKNNSGKISHANEKNMIDILNINKESSGPLKYRFIVSPIINFTKRVKNYVQNNKVDGFTFNDNCYELAATQLLETWLLNKYIADRLGAKYLAILQPNVITGKPTVSNTGKYSKLHTNNGYINLNNTQLKIYPIMYNKIIEKLKEDKYKILNKHVRIYTDIFNNKSNIYIDYCHVTANGNNIVAERIWEDYNGIKN